MANQRFEIVRRHLNGEPPPDGPSVPERTLRLWARQIQGSEGTARQGRRPETLLMMASPGARLPGGTRAGRMFSYWINRCLRKMIWTQIVRDTFSQSAEL